MGWRDDPGSPKFIEKMIRGSTKTANLLLRSYLQPGEKVIATYPIPDTYVANQKYGRIYLTTTAVLDGRYQPPVRWDIDLLRGITASSGYVRLGFSMENGEELTTLTWYMPGSGHLIDHFYGHLAAVWAINAGQDFPSAQMLNNPLMPEIQFEGDQPSIAAAPTHSPAARVSRRPPPKRRR